MSVSGLKVGVIYLFAGSRPEGGGYPLERAAYFTVAALWKR